MLAFTIRTALRYPFAVIGAALVLLVYGSLVVLHGKYDVFPEFVPAQADIQTEAPGMLAEDVERLVTKPLENAINGGGNIANVRSESAQGLSVVKVTFAEGTDIFRDRQLLAERVAEVAPALPAGVGQPILGAMTSSTMDLLKVGFTSDKLSPLELRDLVEWTVRPRLLAVPGVARAIVYGGGRREIQIAPDPLKLHAYQLGISDLTTAVTEAIALRASGFVDTPTQRVLMRATAEATTAGAIAAATLTRNTGANLTIGDVAQVSYAAQPKFGDAHVQGQPDVLLSLGSQYLANTLEVTQRVEAALAELKPMLEARGVTSFNSLHRPATFIENALQGIRNALLYGAALVAAMLILFLRSWRSALISFVTIPLALLFAVLVMEKLGWTLNTMTMSGLAVSIGVVVDDAIIDVENIMRRLRLAREEGSVSTLDAIVFNASVEVRRPILLATLIVAVVFIPALMLPGLQGNFFAPLATAFLLATLGSLIVALTVTPALCLLFLKYENSGHEPGWLLSLKKLQHHILHAFRHGSVVLLAVSMLAGVVALVWAGSFGRELMPMFREGHLVVQFFGPVGANLQAMTQVGDEVSRQMLQIPGIATVSQQVGRAESGEDTWEPSRSEFHVELAQGLNANDEIEIQDKVHALLKDFPGFQYEVLTFLGDRISESISGEASPVTVSVVGPELDALDSTATTVAALLKGAEPAADVQLSSTALLPTMQVRLLPQALAAYGLRATEVLEVVQAAYAGTVAGQVYTNDQALNVRIKLTDTHMLDPEAVGELLIHTSKGLDVPLSALADLDLLESRSMVLHEGGLRRQVVNVSPHGNDVVGYVQTIKAKLAQELKLPQGVYLEFGGVAEEAMAATRDLLVSALFAALVCFLLLWSAFRSLRAVALILVNVPFAMLGGVIAVGISNASISVGTMVGFVTLFGISARNAIMLISHYEHLRNEEQQAWNLALALRGARERLIPILMTALVTALGLLPLALGSGEAGREIEGPMAIVILGGLLSSTVLNLLVLPVIAARFLYAEPVDVASGAALAS